MKLPTILMATALAAACLAASAAAPQSDKNPPPVNNVRFGDPTSIARKYQGFLYGVVKELNSNQLVLTQTKYGTDQSFKIDKRTKYIRDGKSSSFDNLKLGDRVFIDADKDKRTGNLLAKKVVSGMDIPSTPSATP
jgi:leucyl aminopeptidase (aminopeptidase T)